MLLIGLYLRYSTYGSLLYNKVIVVLRNISRIFLEFHYFFLIQFKESLRNNTERALLFFAVLFLLQTLKSETSFLVRK